METEQRQTKLAKVQQDADDERRMLQQRLTLKAQQAEFDAAKEREQHERELAMRAERFDQHLLLSQRQVTARPCINFNALHQRVKSSITITFQNRATLICVMN